MNAPQRVIWPQAISSWGPEEERAAIECIRSGDLTMGSRVAAFEEAFAQHVGSKHAVMVNSGSSANLIAVAALSALGRIQPGGEVIVPALAWATTYAPLQQYGLRLRVVDVDPETLNIDVSQARRAVTWKTQAIVAVNLLGNPANLPELCALATGNGLALIEDNCEAMGATIDGRHCGTFGHVGTFSFFFSHHLNTVEGGMLVTDDADIADAARCLRAHGWTRDLPAGHAWRRGGDFDRDYDFAFPGYNVRPTEIAAAVGLVQLKRLPEQAAIRRANAEAFDAALPHPWHGQRRDVGAVPFALPMVSVAAGWRDRAIERLRTIGAECRPIAGGCFTRHQAAGRYSWSGAAPNAEWIHDKGLMLGNHPTDLSAQIQALAEALP